MVKENNILDMWLDFRYESLAEITDEFFIQWNISFICSEYTKCYLF